MKTIETIRTQSAECLMNQLHPMWMQSFAAIAAHGSVARAARQVHRTSSAVSMHLKQLESAVGAPLFERTTRSMKLTPQGEKFLPYVHQLLDLQSAACAAVQPTVAETVWRIGISEYFLTQQLQALLGWLQRASQGMRLELLWASSAELLRLWQSDAVDLIVVTSAEPLAEAQLLHREPLAWVSAPDHAPRPDQPVPLVLLGAECPVRHIALTALSRTGKAHELRLSCSGSQAAIAALRAGWGVGCLNASAIPEDLQRLSRLDARQWPSPGRLAFYGLARTELQPVLRSLGPWARRLLAGRRPHDSTAPQTS